MSPEEAEGRQEEVVSVVLTDGGVETVRQEVTLGQVEAGQARDPAQDGGGYRQPLGDPVEVEMVEAVTDGIAESVSGQDGGQGELVMVVICLTTRMVLVMICLTTGITDLGDPPVVVENSSPPDGGWDLREGLSRRGEEHPEVDVVYDVVGLGELQPGQTGQVLTNGLVELDH